MANPQIEDGHTKIANEIMDALCRIRIPGEEMQVLNTILRKTYGWNKCEDAIALSQFVEATGINKPCIIRAIHGLLSKKIITVIEKDNAPAKVYRINKDYDQWQPLSKKITLSKKIIGVIEKDNPSLSKKIPTKAITTKDTITKTNILLPEGLSKETFDEFLSLRKAKHAPLLQESYPRFFKKLRKICDSSRASPEEIINQSIVNGYQGIFELKTGGNNGNGTRPGTFRTSKPEAFIKTGANSDGEPYPVDAEY